MDSYFDKVIGQNFEVFVILVGIFLRKVLLKKFVVKFLNFIQLLVKMFSVVSEVVEGVEELFNEKFEELDF